MGMKPAAKGRFLGLSVLCRLSDHAGDRSGRANVRAITRDRWNLHSDGGRDGLYGCDPGCELGGHEGHGSTSGPGFSLMLENISLGLCTETPCVVCNVQRAGPSTGLPTLVAQADMMQARWGAHGHYEAIAVSLLLLRRCSILRSGPLTSPNSTGCQ